MAAYGCVRDESEFACSISSATGYDHFLSPPHESVLRSGAGYAPVAAMPLPQNDAECLESAPSMASSSACSTGIIPPHFHAVYAGSEAKFDVSTLEMIEGSIPPRAIRLVPEWAELHRSELAADWDRAVQRLPLRPIEPLA